jgi:hypothetical protein
MTKTKIALVIALLAGSASAALAQDADPNLLNRYPSYNGAGGVADSPVVVAPRAFQSAPVALRQGRGIDRAPVATGSRPQVETFRYDSAPLISGGS